MLNSNRGPSDSEEVAGFEMRYNPIRGDGSKHSACRHAPRVVCAAVLPQRRPDADNVRIPRNADGTPSKLVALRGCVDGEKQTQRLAAPQRRPDADGMMLAAARAD
jgi:hypothetical protein